MLREFRSKQHDHAGVINPHQNHGQRTGGAESIAGMATPEVEANDEFAELEQECRGNRAYPDRAPANRGVGEIDGAWFAAFADDVHFGFSCFKRSPIE